MLLQYLCNKKIAQDKVPNLPKRSQVRGTIEHRVPIPIDTFISSDKSDQDGNDPVVNHRYPARQQWQRLIEGTIPLDAING